MFCSSWGGYICFHEKYYIPTIEELSSHLDSVSIIGSMEFGKTRNDCFGGNASKNNIKFKNIMQKIQQIKRYRNTESTLGQK